MLGSRRGRGRERVTCPACGATVRRDEAREYDKHGDRWEREGKAFEYVCKPCHRGLCHQPRGELESLLVDSDAGAVDRSTFLRRYGRLVEERYGPLEER